MNSYSNAGHNTSRNWSKPRKLFSSLSVISEYLKLKFATPHYLQQQWGGPLLFDLRWVKAGGLVRGRNLRWDRWNLLFHTPKYFREGPVEEADRIQGLKTINIAVLFGWQYENCKKFRKKIEKKSKNNKHCCIKYSDDNMYLFNFTKWVVALVFFSHMLIIFLIVEKSVDATMHRKINLVYICFGHENIKKWNRISLPTRTQMTLKNLPPPNASYLILDLTLRLGVWPKSVWIRICKYGLQCIYEFKI